MILGVVPARGGSVRIPRKNLAPVAGHPLVAWTLGAARQSRTLDDVLVSTEDEEIAEVARQWGITVLERPADLAQASTPDHPVLRHAVEARDLQGYDDLVVHLRPTAPLRTAEDIDAAVTWFRSRWASCLRSVRLAREHPAKMFRALPEDSAPWAGFVPLVPFDPVRHAPNDPGQCLDLVWMPTGFVDVIRAPFIRWGETCTGPRVATWLTPKARDLDIDDADDLAEADRRLREAGRVP